MERVIDTFIAPSKTFNDILRSASWWLPWLLSVLVTLGFSAAIQQKIGWDKTYSNIATQLGIAAGEVGAASPGSAGETESDRGVVH